MAVTLPWLIGLGCLDFVLFFLCLAGCGRDDVGNVILAHGVGQKIFDEWLLRFRHSISLAFKDPMLLVAIGGR